MLFLDPHGEPVARRKVMFEWNREPDGCSNGCEDVDDRNDGIKSCVVGIVDACHHACKYDRGLNKAHAEGETADSYVHSIPRIIDTATDSKAEVTLKSARIAYNAGEPCDEAI